MDPLETPILLLPFILVVKLYLFSLEHLDLPLISINAKLPLELPLLHLTLDACQVLVPLLVRETSQLICKDLSVVHYRSQGVLTVELLGVIGVPNIVCYTWCINHLIIAFLVTDFRLFPDLLLSGESRLLDNQTL